MTRYFLSEYDIRFNTCGVAFTENIPFEWVLLSFRGSFFHSIEITTCRRLREINLDTRF